MPWVLDCLADGGSEACNGVVGGFGLDGLVESWEGGGGEAERRCDGTDVRWDGLVETVGEGGGVDCDCDGGGEVTDLGGVLVDVVGDEVRLG